MPTKKRMGGKRLSDFGGQPAPVPSDLTPEPVAATPPPLPLESEPPPVAKTPKRHTHPKQEERLVTVNIKIKKSQQKWLTDTAQLVRQNNDAPVPASDRVYPQHLIQTAIDILQSSDVDWAQIKNIHDLREALKV